MKKYVVTLTEEERNFLTGMTLKSIKCLDSTGM